MRTGQLRRRLDIQAPPAATARDTFGQRPATWTPVLTGVPAQLEALDTRELVAAQAINAQVSHRITFRYHPLLADPIKCAGLRAVYLNEGVTRYFNFGPVEIVDERNRVIKILATEGLNQG